jgi:purine-nucleoside phosphorylase
MSDAYDSKLNGRAKAIAAKHRIKLHEGVYASVTGPALETKAEYKYLRIIGADAVGMSTVPEVIVARHMNMNVLAVSVITDKGNPPPAHKVTIAHVIAAAAAAEPSLSVLFRELLAEL